jgi:hypothetical protein
MGKNTLVIIRYTALFLVLALLIPAIGNAAAIETAQPRASAYLSNYGAYVYLPGDGEVRVYFNVTGTGYVDELGALSIAIYESTDGVNWTWKDTFKHDLNPGMLSYNDYFHSGYVSYNGIVGRYYRAYVCIWGGKDGDGDTRYFWTSVMH